MTGRRATLSAINCTSCGAAVPALGGHRARSLTCVYCGAVMDRHDGYRMLAKYEAMPRPPGPLSVGMEGDVLGVRHTVIGIVGVDTMIEGVRYRWTDYQIYAPTHGYSWLTWNNGHLTHTRRTRERPDEGGVSHFAARAPLDVGGMRYRLFEDYDARIHYIEGSLTWVPAPGDTVRVIEAVDPPYGYAIAYGDTEVEYERSTYLDRAAVLTSFGVDGDLPRTQGVHPIQPFRPGALHRALSEAGRLMILPAGLLALGLLVFGAGETVTRVTVPDPRAGGAFSFPLSQPDRLAEITIAAGVRNAWAWYDFSLENAESGETVAEFDAGVEYYEGVEDGERWTEGSTTATLRFKPPVAGAYRLVIEGLERGSHTGPLDIEIREGVMLSRYALGLAVFLAACAVSLPLRRHSFEGKRWSDSDGEDDDD